MPQVESIAGDDAEEVLGRLVAITEILSNEKAALHRRDALIRRAWELGFTHQRIATICHVSRPLVTKIINERKAS